MTVPLWLNPKLYGMLGFILVASPPLFFFRGHEKVKLKTVLEKTPSMQHPPAP